MIFVTNVIQIKVEKARDFQMINVQTIKEDLELMEAVGDVNMRRSD